MVQPNYKEVEDTEEENTNNSNGGDEDFEIANAMHEGESSHQEPGPSKKKCYRRHSLHQIQEMETFFKECPHPDDRQRRELSRQLGLDHLQIKFWFQNKRTQIKNQQERQENAQLRTENDKLRADNYRFRDAIANASCPKCGSQTAIGEMSSEEHQLQLENDRLKAEIERLSVLAEKCMGKMVMSYPAMSGPTIPPRPFGIGMVGIGSGDHVYGNGGNFSRSSITGRLTDVESKIIELAVGAMEEFMVMAQTGEPLWNMGQVNNGSTLALNMDEYKNTFQNGLWPTPLGFRTEASKESATMAMYPINIVDMLVHVNKWSWWFAGMIARTSTPEFLSTGDQDFSGSLQLITAELQVLSPLVSTRKVAFARYCKKLRAGLWAVVDVSFDHILPNHENKCRRRPSGCLIREIQNGYSEVTWVEHVDVDDRGDVHNMYMHLVCTGQALGARRWLATLDRQCDRLTSIQMATSFPSLESNDLTNHGKKGLLKLAERMARTFFGGLNTSTDTWSVLSGNAGDNIRLMTRSSARRPSGVILCTATSFWVPVPTKTLFEFLRDENIRPLWDVMCVEGTVQKVSQIPNGRDQRNCVSLFGCISNQSQVMMIQESSTDPTASFVIYAPIGQSDLSKIVNGGDPDYVSLLPSGFAILPDGSGHPGGGSLLTVAFQILVHEDPSEMLTTSSVATSENLMLLTIGKIRELFNCQDP